MQWQVIGQPATHIGRGQQQSIEDQQQHQQYDAECWPQLRPMAAVDQGFCQMQGACLISLFETCAVSILTRFDIHMKSN